MFISIEYIIMIIVAVVGLYIGGLWDDFLEIVFPTNLDASNNNPFRYYFFFFLGWGIIIGICILIADAIIEWF